MSVSGQVPMDITHGPTPMEVDPMQVTHVHFRWKGHTIQVNQAYGIVPY